MMQNELHMNEQNVRRCSRAHAYVEGASAEETDIDEGPVECLEQERRHRVYGT
jgi:hypothetical protein